MESLDLQNVKEWQSRSLYNTSFIPSKASKAYGICLKLKSMKIILIKAIT